MTMNEMLEGKKLSYQHHPNGTTYVYEVLERHWDKDKQQARNKQICIGKLDPKTGDFIPSRRFSEQGLAAGDASVTAVTTVWGPALLLRQVDREIGLSAVLRKASPELWRDILAMAWYIVITGQALSNADLWLQQHESPTEKLLSSQRISELLAKIDEEVRQTFFRLWGGALAKGDRLCYDITSVSSYAEQNEYVRWGYNRDKESLPQINLAMVYGQQSQLPVTYRELSGSISDVRTLSNLLHQFDKLNYPKLHLVLDRGFYSKANVDHLCRSGQHFTLAVPTHINWVRLLIDQYREIVDSPDGLHRTDAESVYAHTILYPWGESRRRCYAHLYYDAQRVADDRTRFDNQILDWEEELLKEQLVPEHEEAYARFFTVKTTPKRGRRVTRNSKAILAARKQYVGFTVILTSKHKNPLESLRIYREKDVVEKCFDDLKNTLDMKRLRVHRPAQMKGRLFIQFIALILLAQIRKTMRSRGLTPKYTARRLLMELESLTKIHYAGRYKDRFSELTKAQGEILTAFGVDTTTLS